ncbi:hypothetical protein E4U54_001210 [Claviceps lovelessii]|nr:hypothetical protein E4U54_001210 [Claviceps lovelessii]
MGANSKKPPPLPAPTETDTTTPSELGTDISKPGDEKSSYSIPEDGSPVTIRTRGHRSNKSQTSLLIEYFEGGKNSSGQDRKPSVRVRLTPSKKSKGDHIQVTETKSTRKAALTRRIPLDQAIASREIPLHDGEDANSTTSYASATEESNVSRNPIDIEIDRGHRRRRPSSPLIPSTEPYHPGNPSEISAIPPDSFLDGTVPGGGGGGGGGDGDPRASLSPSRGDGIATTAAAAAAAAARNGAATGDMSSNKTRSKDRAKTSEKSKDKSDRKRQTNNKSKASMNSEHKEDERSQRHRQSRSHLESNISGVDSSVVSSHLASSHRSLDTRSTRSGASKASSINNPKLLETVEDAIRRLILPELSALKREQSKRESRRGSVSSSATSISREDGSSDRRRSSGVRAEGAGDAGKRKERRNREARHEYDDDGSLHSPSHDSMAADYQTHERGVSTSKQSNNLIKAAAAGALGAALAKGGAAASSFDKDGSELSEKKSRDRRRRRTEHTRSRSLGRNMLNGENLYDEDDDYDDDDIGPAPPMPLMSDINPSELTRTSILSAESDGPHSASEELVGPALGTVREESTPSVASTPTPINSTAFDHERHAMAMQHANVSHGDLKALPRGSTERAEEYETDEYGRKGPLASYDDEYNRSQRASGQTSYQEDDYEDRYFSTQDVPPPLRYVPYQAGLRGLSPIPSVSGYTEGGSEGPLPQNSADLPSPSKTPEDTRQQQQQQQQQQQHHHLSSPSDVSVSRNVREYEQLSADGANQRDETASGQTVRGIGAVPRFVHPPFGVESAVASLVDGSMLDQSVVTGASGASGYDHNAARDSTVSSNNEQGRGAGSSDQVKMNDAHEVEEDGAATPGSKSVAAQSQEHSEYDLDEHGRKIPRTKYRHSPTASEAAITAGAVGAAAAALKAAKERRQAVETAAGQPAQVFQPAGVARNRSFKDRTMHHGWEPHNTPTHSTDRLDLEEDPKLGVSGVPDVNDPMPEIGYVDDELQTNPSIMEERLDVIPMSEQWSGRVTPTQHDFHGTHGDENHEGKTRGREGAGIEVENEQERPGGGLGISGGAVDAATQNNDTTGREEDEWRRTSEERKRDTLITNPYEDTSPMMNSQLNDTLLGARGLGPGFSTGSPGFGQKYDEGYMSNGPNRTPEVQQSKGKAVDFQPTVAEDEDPFYAPKNHGRHLSGISQGMTSPFYDAATGAGLDRIENKDIVALMQHLMVRDAQRSARDTEIVALLMNAALEMRNSFREMKELVQDTGDDVIFSNVENTEKLQKAINGPRPYPSGAASRSIQSPSHAGTIDENGFKKKTLWKRALQGLSNKGTSDLSRIEDMLMHLLGEVDVLKTQTARPMSTGGPGQSYENFQPEIPQDNDKAYDVQGSSPPTHANKPPAALSMRSRGPEGSIGGGDGGGRGERRISEHRIGIMPGNENENDSEGESENDNEDEDANEYRYEGAGPSAERSAGGDYLQTPRQAEKPQRFGSVPLETPPRLAPAVEPQPLSAENTPRTDKGKKNKSSGSMGWFPRISRWSGTTASSVGKAFRGKKGSKNDDFQPPARSGSSLSSYDGDVDPTFGPELYDGDDKMHRRFSDFSLGATRGENGQPSSSFHGGLSPSQYMTPEDPKYKAHRNSLNLQHPQPRPGQTERFRTALESSAQEYNHNPVTPRSTDWAGSATSLNRLPPNNNRFSQASSVHGAETDYYSSPGQQSAPPRPPKEPIDFPHAPTPPVSSRLSRLQKDGGSPGPQQSSESGYGTMTGTYLSHYSGSSPKLENRNLNAALGVPTRRPTGPRAMTPKSPEDTVREERRRKRGTDRNDSL